MAFVARCTFCHLILREVPEQRLGSSVDCPRCGNSFTLAEATDAVAAASRSPRGDAADPPAAAPMAVEVPVAPPLTSLVEGSGLTRPPAEPTPVEDVPAVAVAEPPQAPAAPPAPAPRFTNYPGLASFLLGCFAFLAGSVLHAGLATLALGLLGLLLGVFGLLFPWLVPCRRVLPAAGLAVSLPALLLPLLAPDWISLDRVVGRRRPVERGDAAMPLVGNGEVRRATGAEPLWADAGHDALIHGDVRLRVTSAVVGPAEFEPVQGRSPPVERCLVIGLRLTNAGVLRKLPYTGWAVGDPARDPVLRDAQGKEYPTRAFAAGWVVKGRAPSATIPPGKWHDDVLAFEAPPRGAGPLRLELPAAAAGAEGRLRVEIPNQMILFR
ncbi:MAG TPA: hypothetical protein VFW33_09640 [Gemmataceae bacterium]|nr:hypothetical protein [Gemmataceae bacterium]